MLSRQYLITSRNFASDFGREAAKSILRSIRPRGSKAGQRHNHKGVQAINKNNIDFYRGIDSRNLIEVDIVKQSTGYGSKNLSFGLWNARSLNSQKIPALCASVLDNKTDILMVTETWMTARSVQQSEFRSALSGYSFFNCPRRGRKGGGISVIVRDNLRVEADTSHQHKTFEVIDLKIRFLSVLIHLAVIYRPPPSVKNGCTVNEFLEEFGSFLECAAVAPGVLMMAGDFNFHVDNDNDPDAGKFLDLLTSFNLKQHVTSPTHEKGHTLDLVITRDSEDILRDLTVDSCLQSDHSLILFRSCISRPRPQVVTRVCRKTKSVTRDDLLHAIADTPIPLPGPEVDVETLVQNYNTTLQQVLNDVAPEKEVRFVDKPKAPWYTEEQRQAKKELRSFERKMKANPLEINKQIYKAKRLEYNLQLEEAKSDYHRSRIMNSDQKQLFSVIDEMVGEKKASASILPDHDNPQILAQKFAEFFRDKILILRDSLDRSVHEPRITDAVSTAHSFEEFLPVTTESLTKVIKNMNSKSCGLDPMPTHLVKSVLPEIIDLLVQTVNKSFSSSKIPDTFKTAVVRPLLKKSGVDKNELKNYRPVSNLPFAFKLLEKCALTQLNQYMQNSSLFSVFQSAFRQNHSCETTLLKVHNDVMMSLDNHREVILVLLDLTAAFDTIDPFILLERLEKRFGVKGTALKWFESYISGRTQSVVIGKGNSEAIALPCGVPQGSVLGPILFTLYASPLEDILAKHNMDFQSFADDTQLYLSCKKAVDSSSIIEVCVQDIRQWMIQNKLVLNDSKTEILHFHSPFRTTGALPSLKIGECSVDVSNTVRDLGFYFDSHATINAHITHLAKSASFALYRIGKIRNLIDRTTTERLVHAFITSRLDFCNSLLYKHHDTTSTGKLQRLQNTAARLITRTARNEHITPVLRELHWLPVAKRVEFKILVLTYKSLNDQAPVYLQSLVTFQSSRSSRPLRSANDCRLYEPRYNLEHYGAHAFSIAAPRLWNALPNEIRTAPSLDAFKRTLKTHLFKSYYGL